MKYLIGPLLILLTLFSCKKNEIDFKTQQLLLLGKWELKSPAHDDSFVGEIKERSFDFGPDSVGIRGIELLGRWGTHLWAGTEMLQN